MIGSFGPFGKSFFLALNPEPMADLETSQEFSGVEPAWVSGAQALVCII